MSKLIYLCPVLINCLGLFICFAVLYAAGERQIGLGSCAWLGVAFQGVYMIFSLILGLILSRRNARRFLMASVVLNVVIGLFLLNTISFPLLIIEMGILGFVCAIFYNSFQTVMRGEAPPGNLTQSVGFYTMAWSIGGAAGFFLSGCFYRLGTLILSLVSVIIGVLVMAILIIQRPRPIEQLSAEENVEQGFARKVNPIYVWTGWLIIITAVFVQRPIFIFTPAIGAATGISSFMAGFPLFLHMLIQGLFGMAMVRFRKLLYRRTPLLIFHFTAAIIFLIIWRFFSFGLYFVGVCLLGVYGGFAYFSCVLYASNSGRRSFNIGVNECLVGMGSIAGLFAAEWWMRYSGKHEGMFLVCGIALLVFTAIQVIVALIPAKRV